MDDAIAQLRRLFAWDHWANRAALDSFSTLPVPPAKALKIMAHIVVAEVLWLARLQGEDTSALPVWPEWTAEEIAVDLERLEHAWRVFLQPLHAADLKTRAAYTNSKGERWENSMGDMLQHVILHGAYHRGQIAADVRAAGGEPAYTDFIEAVRRGYVK